MEPPFPHDVSVSDRKEPSVGEGKTLYPKRCFTCGNCQLREDAVQQHSLSASILERMPCHLLISEKVLVCLRSGIRDYEQRLERGARLAPTLRLMQKAVP